MFHGSANSLQGSSIYDVHRKGKGGWQVASKNFETCFKPHTAIAFESVEWMSLKQSKHNEDKSRRGCRSSVARFQFYKKQGTYFERSGREVFWKLSVRPATLGVFEDFGDIFPTCSTNFTKISKVGKIFYQYFFVSNKICYIKLIVATRITNINNSLTMISMKLSDSISIQGWYVKNVLLIQCWL